MAGSAIKRTAVAVVLAAAFSSVRANSDEVRVFAEPTRLSFRVGFLDRDQPVEILRLFNSWALVRQGTTVGWAPLKRVEDAFQVRWADDLGRSPWDGFSSPESTLESSAGTWTSQWTGLLEFAGGDLDQRRRMEELREGSRALAVSSQWGPLFYRRTPHYYWKGIQLWEVLDDRLSLNLIKGKYNQQALYGGLWSDNLLESLVESNRGVFGNRSLFGKGRNYFFELRYSF